MDLAAEVEAAGQGDEALARRILQAVGWHVDMCACPTGGRGVRRPEPGLWRRPDGEYHFTTQPPATACAATLALALCAAALRLRR